MTYSQDVSSTVSNAFSRFNNSLNNLYISKQYCRTCYCYNKDDHWNCDKEKCNDLTMEMEQNLDLYKNTVLRVVLSQI